MTCILKCVTQTSLQHAGLQTGCVPATLVSMKTNTVAITHPYSVFGSRGQGNHMCVSNCMRCFIWRGFSVYHSNNLLLFYITCTLFTTHMLLHLMESSQVCLPSMKNTKTSCPGVALQCHLHIFFNC